MSSGSVRLHAPMDIHQHGVPDEGGQPIIPDSRSETIATFRNDTAMGELSREDGKTIYRSSPDQAGEPARVVWARPLSNRDSESSVSILMAEKKRELAYVPSLDLLSPASRRIAEEELGMGMVLPRITAILQVKPRFGNYYFDVETDLGARRFLLSSPENNSFRPKPDVIVVKDVSGNCYEINPVSGLDKNSLAELDRVL